MRLLRAITFRSLFFGIALPCSIVFIIFMLLMLAISPKPRGRKTFLQDISLLLIACVIAVNILAIRYMRESKYADTLYPY